MAETTYNYTRAAIPAGAKTGEWDVPNPYANQSLAKDIETDLPGKVFKVKCAGANCDVTFSDALIAADKTILDTTVSDHQAVTESNQLQNNKDIKNVAIDKRTKELILEGFTFDSETFSLSEFAQLNWNDIKTSTTDYTFPLEIPTLNSYKYSLTQGNVNGFWDAKKTAIWGHLDSGRALNVSVVDATNQTELDAVVDSR